MRPTEDIPAGSIGLNAVQRRIVRLSSGDRCAAEPFNPPPPPAPFHAVLLNAEVDFITKKAVKGPDVEVDAQGLASHLQSRFMGQVRRRGARSGRPLGGGTLRGCAWEERGELSRGEATPNVLTPLLPSRRLLLVLILPLLPSLSRW